MRSCQANLSCICDEATPTAIDNATEEQWAKGTAAMRRAKHIEVVTIALQTRIPNELSTYTTPHQKTTCSTASPSRSIELRSKIFVS